MNATKVARPAVDPLAEERDAWRLELVRAARGGELLAVEAAVASRALLAYFRMLAGGAPVLCRPTAQAVVRMARYLRMLGLTRQDVHRLDLGRRRRAVPLH